MDVSDDTYVYFELGIPDATVGATIEWALMLDGEKVMQDDLELDEPLEDGHVFFVQFEADSVGDIRDWLNDR